MRAWHFVGATLRNGDPVPKDRVWLKYPGRCEICQSGLHASKHPFDALRYAPGPILCLVDCRKIVVRQNDKFVCHERKIVARMDATELLRYFTRMQAISVIHLWDAPEVVLDYLMTGNDSLRDAAWAAARYAAGDAAWDAASEAARAAAGYAAGYAAWAAAWAAAGAAAWDAARAAAGDAAWAAAGAAAGADFLLLVNECFGIK